MIRFNFDESKTLEALVYVARAWDAITPFYLSKVLFFADRNHLRAYGRPITGDSYIAMVDGPVPSRSFSAIPKPLRRRLRSIEMPGITEYPPSVIPT
jgi:uncharacterized phage-associated protein